MSGRLPDPHWSAREGYCLACGYSLEGLPPDGACPECGALFCANQLIVAGIPNRIRGGSPLRRLAWVFIIALAIVYSWFWVLLILQVGWLVTLVGFLVLIGGLGALFKTSPRERRGAERYCIMPMGLVRLPLVEQPDPSRDAQLVVWPPDAEVSLDRIGPVWRRLRVRGRIEPATMPEVIFDAGIRCPDEWADTVLHTLRAAAAGEAAGESPVIPGPPPVRGVTADGARGGR